MWKKINNSKESWTVTEIKKLQSQLQSAGIQEITDWKIIVSLVPTVIIYCLFRLLCVLCLAAKGTFKKNKTGTAVGAS